MFGRLIFQTKAGGYKGKELQLYSCVPTSKAAVPQQQMQPCKQTSLKRSASNKMRILEEGPNAVCLHLSAAQSCLLRYIFSSKQFWFLLAALSLLKSSLQLVHWGQVSLLSKPHTPTRLHRHCCHHFHQPPTGNGTLMVTTSIYWGSWFSSQGSGIFFFVREPINLFPSACPFSLLPFSCMILETPFPLFPCCSHDKKTQLCYKTYYSFIIKYANIYLAASIAHRRVLQLSHIFSLSNIKFVQVPYTIKPTWKPV